MLKQFMEACLSIKFAYLDWLTCKKCLLGGHGKARRTVKERRGKAGTTNVNFNF